MIEFCVQSSINPEALRVKPLLEQGRRWERRKPVLLLIREKYPVVKKRSRKLEMVSNLHLQKIALKVRRDGSQASIFVRTFRSFTTSWTNARPFNGHGFHRIPAPPPTKQSQQLPLPASDRHHLPHRTTHSGTSVKGLLPERGLDLFDLR